jgi:hypothetical protein
MRFDSHNLSSAERDMRNGREVGSRESEMRRKVEESRERDTETQRETERDRDRETERETERGEVEWGQERGEAKKGRVCVEGGRGGGSHHQKVLKHLSIFPPPQWVILSKGM